MQLTGEDVADRLLAGRSEEHQPTGLSSSIGVHQTDLFGSVDGLCFSSVSGELVVARWKHRAMNDGQLSDCIGVCVRVCVRVCACIYCFVYLCATTMYARFLQKPCNYRNH